MSDQHLRTARRQPPGTETPGESELAEFPGKRRGGPIIPAESIDLAQLIGASFTLVASHQQKATGAGSRGVAVPSLATRPRKRVFFQNLFGPPVYDGPRLLNSHLEMNKTRTKGEASGARPSQLLPGVLDKCPQVPRRDQNSSALRCFAGRALGAAVHEPTSSPRATAAAADAGISRASVFRYLKRLVAAGTARTANGLYWLP